MPRPPIRGRSGHRAPTPLRCCIWRQVISAGLRMAGAAPHSLEPTSFCARATRQEVPNPSFAAHAGTEVLLASRRPHTIDRRHGRLHSSHDLRRPIVTANDVVNGREDRKRRRSTSCRSSTVMRAGHRDQRGKGTVSVAGSRTRGATPTTANALADVPKHSQSAAELKALDGGGGH